MTLLKASVVLAAALSLTLWTANTVHKQRSRFILMPGKH